MLRLSRRGPAVHISVNVTSSQRERLICGGNLHVCTREPGAEEVETAAADGGAVATAPLFLAVPSATATAGPGLSNATIE